jgi:hypothetical protein
VGGKAHHGVTRAGRFPGNIRKEPTMHSNIVHNILNAALALVAILSLPEVTAFLPPDVAVMIAGAVGTAKLIINTLRDGITGLVKRQPPVTR